MCKIPRRGFGSTAPTQKAWFGASQTHLGLIRGWFSASAVVVIITTFYSPKSVVCHMRNGLARLKSLDVLADTNRSSSIDIYRSLAVIAVVLFHFGALPFGYLGVDLFFVISGFLVGGLLTKQFVAGKKINFFKFILQRGLKIWPSFYFFIIVGSLLAWCFYHDSRPDLIIPLWDIKRYLLFYQNYTGVPFHWSFDHVWSLCVEEHFYILLPLMFLFIQAFVSDNHKKQTLFVFVILTIVAGIVFKNISYFFTNGKDTFSATHNRIDALAWGVLLNLILTYFQNAIKAFRFKILFFIFGVTTFVITLYSFIHFDNIYFHRIYFHSIIPMTIFFMLLGTYHIDFSKLKPLRFIAYYSYNWYLWHPLFVFIIKVNLGVSMTGIVLYLLVTFTFAFGSTILIEEPFLKNRKLIIGKILGNGKI